MIRIIAGEFRARKLKVPTGNDGILTSSVLWSSDVPVPCRSTGSVLWSTTDTTNSITVSPIQSTDYTVTVDNGTSVCTDSVRVLVSNPMVDIGNEHYIATHDVKGLI